ncbi:cytochrome P450 [Ephemerocybe angulata]|uniref:Cytochrome P450 n=1 Tax=Ephemerocybe angulata TaxID=980116 RepID=A0A8H6I7C9_9AGAR|nr:cytochrome P450 [Tulosesus angulatus]
MFATNGSLHILSKEQGVYEKTEDFLIMNGLIFGNSLPASHGDEHRKQKKMIGPVFSPAHMREILPTCYKVVYTLRDSIKKQIDLAAWMEALATSLDALTENAPEAPIHDFNQESGALPRFRRFFLDIVPWPKLHAIRDMVDVMDATAKEILGQAQKSLKAGDEVDILSILLRTNMLASEEERLPDSDLLGQIGSITFAGMDTTSNSLSRTLHLLSEHHEVQRRLREELQEARMKRGGEDPSFEELMTLPYLDAVCKEVLRLYAPVPFLLRRVRTDMIMPLHTPIQTSFDPKQKLNEIFVPKDTTIIMSLIGCNRNVDVWGEDAAEWKPERWLEPLRESVVGAKVPGVYSHLMTFLGGGRACVGVKFAQLQMKVVLSTLVESFTFAPGSKEIIWQFNGVIQPTTKDAGTTSTGHRKLQLPLKLEIVEKEDVL